MLLYKYGKVVHTNKDYIIFESYGEGISVRVNDSPSFASDKSIKLFIYEHVSDFNKTVYGFKTFKERVLFSDLISISGIGPKIALTLLSNGWENLVNAIITKDINYIGNFPYTSKKIANIVNVFSDRSKPRARFSKQQSNN